MRNLGLILGLIVVACSAGVVAQAPPNFSGTWGSPDSSITIKQDAKTLSVTTAGETRVYNLDGSDSRSEAKAARGTSRYTAQARWVGSALVVSTTTESSIGTWQDLEVYSMDYGPKLTVVKVASQTTRGMMHTTTATFTRAASTVRQPWDLIRDGSLATCRRPISLLVFTSITGLASQAATALERHADQIAGLERQIAELQSLGHRSKSAD